MYRFLILSLATVALLANFQTVSATENTPTTVINTPLQRGYYGAEVFRLQELLAEDKNVYPEGLITGFYGDLTERAVVKYQEVYKISPIGLLTDMTRSKLNEAVDTTDVAVLNTAEVAPLTATIVSGKNTSEIDLLRACMFKSATTSPCEKTDLNQDGVTNVADVALLKSLIKFDLNGDNKVDVRPRGSADVSALAACVYKAAEGACAKADFTGDGVVNFADLSALRGNIKYDLNRDYIVDLNIAKTEAGYFSDIDLIKMCMFQSATGDCVKTDLSGDGVTNFQDVAILKSEEVYDLNLDGKVDLRSDDSGDVVVVKSCIFKPASGDCAKADLNKDAMVNFGDLSLLKAQVKFDLNNDLVVDLRVDVVSL